MILISIVYSGYRPNDEDSQANVIQPVLVGGNAILGISDYEKVLADGSADDAVKLLRSLNDWPRDATLPVKFDYQQKRIGVANRLLELNCLPEQRIFAIESRIEASSFFYGLDFVNNLNLPLAAKQLRESSAPFVDDKNEKIRRKAMLGIAKLEVFEYSKLESDEQFLRTKKAIFSIFEEFCEDPIVVGNIRVLIRRLIRDDIEDGRRLIRELFERYRDSESENVREFAEELNDSLLIADSDYERIVVNRWANGDSGRAKLAKTVVELSGSPDGGESLNRRIEKSLAWFEQVHDFDSASKICDSLIENAPRHNNANVAQQLKRMGESGLKRLGMMGKKLDLHGVTRGNQPASDDFEDCITLVFFFSKESLSTKAMSRLIEFSRMNQKKGIQFLGVSTDQNFDDYEKISNRAPAWKFVRWDDQREPPENGVLSQYPVILAPHIILLDELGVVSRSNVKFSDLQTHIDELLNAQQLRKAAQVNREGNG